ncbi:MAG: ABC transporter permease [Actinomycetota bacterium]|nr:ABC transporter permease [Actinomycetota bacterium]
MASPRVLGTRPLGWGPLRLDRRELTQARELTANLVRRDLKAEHRGSFLGMLWSLTNPLLLVGMYYVVFKYIFRANLLEGATRPDGNDVPFAVYLFSGLTLWNLFSGSVSSATGSVTGAGALLHKVYFPRLILPLSSVLSGLVTFAFEFAVLVVVTLVFVGPPDASILWVPAIVVVVAIFTFGLGSLLASVNVFFRDVQHFIGIGLQLWFWGTPIIYSMEYVQEHDTLVRLLELNPLTGAVISFRNVVVLQRAPDFGLLAYNLLCAVVVLAVGLLVFRRSQRLFPEIV